MSGKEAEGAKENGEEREREREKGNKRNVLRRSPPPPPPLSQSTVDATQKERERKGERVSE